MRPVSHVITPASSLARNGSRVESRAQCLARHPSCVESRASNLSRNLARVVRAREKLPRPRFRGLVPRAPAGFPLESLCRGFLEAVWKAALAQITPRCVCTRSGSGDPHPQAHYGAQVPVWSCLPSQSGMFIRRRVCPACHDTPVCAQPHHSSVSPERVTPKHTLARVVSRNRVSTVFVSCYFC